jgi:hypothetical protein
MTTVIRTEVISRPRTEVLLGGAGTAGTSAVACAGVELMVLLLSRVRDEL